MPQNDIPSKPDRLCDKLQRLKSNKQELLNLEKQFKRSLLALFLLSLLTNIVSNLVTFIFIVAK